jgi:16S rRNA (adenine1518-N6/adenine1519-N6)-dimethyltransferase
LKRKQLRPKKQLGQNFLYDPAIADRIVSAAGLAAGDVAVELGPGRGILTAALVRRGVRTIAIELDEALYAELKERFRDESSVEIIPADFTRVKLSGLLAERGLERCTLIGNIPYNLTRDVLFDFLVDEQAVLSLGCIMLQKEVGERIVSPPGSKVYGIPSVILQSLYEVRTVMKVAPGSFTPRPRVASVVLSFTPLAEPMLEPGELAPFKELVKNLFNQRRKTIQNTLRSFYDLSDEALGEIGARSGIDLGQRPEQLSNETFLELSRTLAEVSSR